MECTLFHACIDNGCKSTLTRNGNLVLRHSSNPDFLARSAQKGWISHSVTMSLNHFSRTMWNATTATCCWIWIEKYLWRIRTNSSTFFIKDPFQRFACRCFYSVRFSFYADTCGSGLNQLRQLCHILFFQNVCKTSSKSCKYSCGADLVRQKITVILKDSRSRFWIRAKNKLRKYNSVRFFAVKRFLSIDDDCK